MQKLLQMLQESSTLQIPDLKKVMQKDKRAAVLFKKDLSLDDIEDKDAFLATLKYYVLNNENVRNFIAMRHNVKDVDKDMLLHYRSMRGKDLTQNTLKWMKEFIQNVFKEYGSVDRGTMSPDLKKQINDWANSNGRYFNLPKWAQNELLSIPSVRPNKRVLLYRGVLFKKYDLEETEQYDGTMEIGNGLKFLRSIKKGTREIELTWDRPSSWTYKKDIADRFAQYGPASSSFSATLQWLERSMEKKNIDGAVGFVISTFANPEDILIDFNRASGIHSQHSDEAEVILKPGSYTARIVKKYTVEAGEVNPDEENTASGDDSVIDTALTAAREFAKTFVLPENTVEMLGDHPIWETDSSRILKDKAAFKKLILNSTTTEIVHLFDKLSDFYNKSLKHIDENSTKAENFAHDENFGRAVQKLRKIIANFTNSVVHSKFKSVKNPKGKGSRHELTGEEFRSTISSHDLRDFERDLMTHGFTTSRNAGNYLTNLAETFRVKLPGSARIQQFGAAKQEPIINEVIDKFFSTVGIDRPENKEESIKTMINLIRKAHRNQIMLNNLKTIKKQFGEL